jgi:Lrp/AsnC family transcriptional regulator, regulator for asnA, asnC and gidA
MADLDDIDRRIISLLQNSSRGTNTEIAAKVGLSESSVRRRISRLLDEDYIKLVAVADPLKIGYPIVAIIGLQCLPSAVDQVELRLADLNEFRFIGMTIGTYDFVAEAWFESLESLRGFVRGRLAAIPGIQRIETVHVLKMVRYLYDWGRATTA